VIVSPASRVAPSFLDRLARSAVLASFVVLPIGKSPQLPVVGSRLTLFDLTAIVALLAWGLARLRRRDWKTATRIPAVDVALVAYFFVAVVSGWAAWNGLHSRVAIGAYALEIAVLAYLIAFFFAARDVLVRSEALRPAVAAWIVGAGIATLLGIVGTLEMFRCSPPLSALVLWSSRLVSTFINPNQLAAFLVPTIAVAAGVWMSSSGATNRQIGLAAFVVLSGGSAIFWSASRGGLVGTASAALVMVALQRRSRAFWNGFAIFAGTVALVWLVGEIASRYANTCVAYAVDNAESLTLRLFEELGIARGLVRSRHVTFGGDTASAFAFRAQMAYFAFMLAKIHPWTGVGLGTMHFYVYELTGHEASVDAHNTFLTVLAETGFFGVALFVWATGWFVWQAFLLTKSASDPWLKPVASGLSAALAGFLVMSISFDGQRQRVLWMMFALVAAASTQRGAKRTTN
jgi:hypothetical protein